MFKDVFVSLDLLEECVPDMYSDCNMYGYDEECARTQHNLETVCKVLSFKRLATVKNIKFCLQFMYEFRGEFYSPVYINACNVIINRLEEMICGGKHTRVFVCCR